jgi:hypothetical protein
MKGGEILDQQLSDSQKCLYFIESFRYSCLPSILFSWDFEVKILYAILISPTRVTCSPPRFNHPNNVRNITLF